MYNKKYDFKVEATSVVSGLRKINDAKNADLYLNKNNNWFKLELKISPSIKDHTLPKTYDIITDNISKVYKTNTLNFDITNIKIDDTYYKYKIEYIGNYTQDDLILYLNLEDIVFLNGVYYTNTSGYYYEDSDNFIYTGSVIDYDSFKAVFKSKYIEVTIPKDCYLVFKDNILTPKILNENSFYIPSFYIIFSDNTRIIRCIESNIETFETDLNYSSNSFLNFRIKSKKDNTISKDLNMLFLNVSKKIEVIKSSHCFSLFFMSQNYNITKNNHIELTTGEGLFSISKIINLDKIDFIINNYKLMSKQIKDNISGKTVLVRHMESPSINSAFLRYIKINKMQSNYVYLKDINVPKELLQKEIYMNIYDKEYKENSKITIVPLSKNSRDDKYANHLPTLINNVEEIIIDKINYSYKKIIKDLGE